MEQKTKETKSLTYVSCKKIGRPAVMMCFVPASFELIGMKEPCTGNL